MLSIGKLGAGGRTERYYTQAVAQGREDYYSGKGEAPGRWVGAGAASLGLSDEVDADDLGALLRGVNPKGGELRSMSQDGAVSGFDVAFHAPKTVSILRWPSFHPAPTTHGNGFGARLCRFAAVRLAVASAGLW